MNRKELPELKAEETCFLIVDMQNDFVSQDGYFGKVAGQDMRPVIDSVPRVASFLNFCRENSIPRVHVKVVHPDYTTAMNWKVRLGDADMNPKICLPNTWGEQIIPELAPAADEPVVTKRRYDGFLDTDLIVILRAFHTRNVLLAGTKTNVCVDTTARHSFCNDFLTVTISDCVSTPDPGMQTPALWNLESYFGYVKSSEQIKQKIILDSNTQLRKEIRLS